MFYEQIPDFSGPLPHIAIFVWQMVDLCVLQKNVAAQIIRYHKFIKPLRPSMHMEEFCKYTHVATTTYVPCECNVHIIYISH